MIATQALCKSYGEFAAVRDLELKVDRGELFGFLARTAPARPPRSHADRHPHSQQRHGRHRRLDCQRERVEVARRVGYVPDTPIFYDFLRGREILEFVGEMHGLSAATPARAPRRCWPSSPSPTPPRSTPSTTPPG